MKNSILVTGQDAEIAACNRIVNGEQAMTISRELQGRESPNRNRISTSCSIENLKFPCISPIEQVLISIFILQTSYKNYLSHKETL